MRQNNSLPEVRLVCLIPPSQVLDLPSNSRPQQLEELKAFLCSTGQITIDRLTDQVLEHFCAWSGLPWSALQPFQVKQY